MMLRAKERLGHPSKLTIDENVEKVKKIVAENRRITIREAAKDGSCLAIASDVLDMNRVAAKFALKLPNFD